MLLLLLLGWDYNMVSASGNLRFTPCTNASLEPTSRSLGGIFFTLNNTDQQNATLLQLKAQSYCTCASPKGPKGLMPQSRNTAHVSNKKVIVGQTPFKARLTCLAPLSLGWCCKSPALDGRSVTACTGSVFSHVPFDPWSAAAWAVRAGEELPSLMFCLLRTQRGMTADSFSSLGKTASLWNVGTSRRKRNIEV